MLKLSLYDAESQLVESRQHASETYLAYKTREYSLGEKIVLEVKEAPLYVWVQVDEALSPSLIYLKEKRWEFPIVTDDELRRAYSPKLFSGERHYIRAWLPVDYEVKNYRNLALNAHDQKQDSGAFPHAHANVETRNDSTFFARNAIDGMIANESHGSFPYQSWGINQQADAEITIDFGREVHTDKVAFVLRGDYPHDSYWTQVTLVFSDGAEIIFNPTDALDRQFFTFSEKRTTTVTLKNLMKHEDEALFPALTEFEVYGIDAE
ncbi:MULTISPECIES: hypothetical protein [unclassified Enterococcus]|uniref:hypothetical protein n=1 Tax=unclassified Enterococcus TaxID=2608891 RepID=UPI000A331C37|nr:MULTISPECIES: hypothetical protein [unclassified Enterococcus]OTO77324.1 hypothetical protein A5865_001200 [Enterococcus sp. 12E11_DIV0728]OUZ16507.1 hypothetical protein A5868_001428 [Enterococcus sp. 12F9_DIV0723]